MVALPIVMWIERGFIWPLGTKHRLEGVKNFFYTLRVVGYGDIAAVVYQRNLCFFFNQKYCSRTFYRKRDETRGYGDDVVFDTPHEQVAAGHNFGRGEIAKATRAAREKKERKEELEELAKNTDWYVLDKLKGN
jgi:hypothetical protein